jgi:hypothetical protein
MSRITVDQLYASYGAYLRAKVQEIEFQGWGPGMVESFRKTMAEHGELEASYLRQMLADRRIADEEMKVKLDAIDKEEKERRKRR